LLRVTQENKSGCFSEHSVRTPSTT